MKKIGKFLTPGVTVFLFVLAGALLLTGSIGGTRAALEYFSSEYMAEVQLYDIGVTLLENGNDVAHRNYNYTTTNGYRNSDGSWDDTNTGVLLMSDAWKSEHGITEENPFRPGVKYEERLAAANTGTINQYVRMTITKFWCDNVTESNGKIVSYNKRPDLDPSLIDIEFTNIGSHWTEDTNARTDERTVLYYNELLGSGRRTEECTSSIKINGDVAVKVSEESDGKGGVKTVYDYDGATFILMATVDAVQEHNAPEAMRSAWGLVAP